MTIIITGYPRLRTDIAANSAITIMTVDHRRLCIIMQDNEGDNLFSFMNKLLYYSHR